MTYTEDMLLGSLDRKRRNGIVPYGAALTDLAKKALGPVEYAVTCLMSRPVLRNLILEPEQRLSIAFADKLRELAREGRLRCVWTHCANESKRSVAVAAILKAMGMVSGAPDFWFIGKHGGGLIELKRPDQKLPELKDNQAHFQLWAKSQGVRHAVHNSVDGAVAMLKEWEMVA